MTHNTSKTFVLQTQKYFLKAKRKKKIHAKNNFTGKKVKRKSF